MSFRSLGGYLIRHTVQKLDAKEALPKIRALLGDHERSHFDRLVPVADAAREAIIKLERP